MKNLFRPSVILSIGVAVALGIGAWKNGGNPFVTNVVVDGKKKEGDE